PGTEVSGKGRKRPLVRVRMLPAAGMVASKLSALQPSMKRLALFWQSDSFDVTARDMKEALAIFGVEARLEKLGSADQLPDRLRALQGKADALWIPTDPTLVNPRSFS